MGRLVASWVGVWGVALGELALVLVLSRRDFAGLWEMEHGTLRLLPVLLAATGAVALVAALAWELVRRSSQASARAALGALLGVLAAAAAWGVGGGRHLASFGRRGAFALAVGTGAFVVARAIAPRVARLGARRPRALAAAAASAVVLAEIANRVLLVRLYPAFHMGLTALALLAAPGLAWGWEPRRPGRWAFGLATLLGVSVALLRPAAERLARFDNVRLLLSERAPIAGAAVLLAAEVAPPPPLDAPADLRPSPTSGARALDLAGRDVLLVTIDALRADHVGAYGYQRATTPEIDRLAAEGALFEHAYCATPHTSYSVTSIMTGKYLRPLLLQGAGLDSDTWASLLRTYGYRTAAFYPPAVFFIDGDRFAPFRDSYLGFEYYKVEFLEGQGRVDQLAGFLATEPGSQRVFAWVHLFAPHEPYEQQAGAAYGDHDVDRYDSEVSFADRTVGELVRRFRAVRPEGVVIVTADHGEEFGDHGGRYHGTTVYEEQARVPLVIVAPGAIAPRRIPAPVQTIDLLPTVLRALDVPRPPRVRGRDLGPALAGEPEALGFAFAETDDQALLATASDRLICARRLGACQLFDVATDPGELRDRSRDEPLVVARLQKELRELGASHGRYEVQGLRAEGRGWPAPILRGISGDGDAAEEIASLLDDADVTIRRKAAELCFDLARAETSTRLRLALQRDEDLAVKRWSALALTRLGQGAPLTRELLDDPDPAWKRPAALALAESGDPAGAAVLVEWWKDAPARDFRRSRELLHAVAVIQARDAVWPLVQSLDDVRLRPFIAEALAQIGEDVARVPLGRALARERYQGARVTIAGALAELGGTTELVEPLTRFLGVPDPLPTGLEVARRAGILERIGGPSSAGLDAARKQLATGAELTVIVPKGGNGQGVRVLVRGRSLGTAAAVLRVGGPLIEFKLNRKGEPVTARNVPILDPSRSLAIELPPGTVSQVAVTPPAGFGARAGAPARLVLFATDAVELDAFAIVPLSDELPPPPPKPWRPGDAED